MKKIIAGLIVVISAAGIIKVISKNEEPVQEEVVQVEESDATDNLYNDTFEEDFIDEDKDEDEYDIEIEDESDVDENEFLNEDNTSITNPADEDTKDESKEETSSQEESSQKTVTGEFQGFADSSVIEVKIGNNYDAFKVSGDVKTKLESKNVGQTITFTYIASAGQKVITSIN